MATVTLGTKPVGSIVEIIESGITQDFYVAQHGYSSSSRTLLVRKYIHSNRQWNNVHTNAYGSSSIDSWLNKEYFALLPNGIQKQISAVNIPYTPKVAGSYSINRAIFLLSCAELGQTDSYINEEGSILPIASTLQIARNSADTMCTQWTRTPYRDSNIHVRFIREDGRLNDSSGNNYATHYQGIRPAFTLPASITVNDSGLIYTNQPPTISDSDRNLGDKATDFSISYTVNDADTGDTLTATESLDGAVKKNFNPVRGATNTIAVSVSALSLGNHTVTVNLSDGKGGTASRTWSFRRINAAPAISGTDQNLGDKNLGFSYSYTVSDPDGDPLTVTEQLNGTPLRTLANPPKGQPLTVEITSAQLYALPLGSVNTLTISANDGRGGIAYRQLTFRRSNSAPTISGQNADLGLQTTGFSKPYTISDVEGDAVQITEKIDSKTLRTYQAVLGQAEEIALSRNEWLLLPNGRHTLRVEASDGNATSARLFDFTKNETVIDFMLAAPFETDAMASKIILTPTWRIEGATARVEACNNAFDAAPTWEDITTQTMINRVYNFINAGKTADRWGINIRLHIERLEGYTGEVSVTNFGGAYE